MILATFIPDHMAQIRPTARQKRHHARLLKEQAHIVEAVAQYPAWTWMDRHRNALASAGLCQVDGGEWLLWGMLSQAVEGQGLKLVRLVRERLNAFASEHSAIVIAHIDPADAEAARFIRMLGFRYREDAATPVGLVHVYERL